jgi:hypothetical protein
MEKLHVAYDRLATKPGECPKEQCEPAQLEQCSASADCRLGQRRRLADAASGLPASLRSVKAEESKDAKSEEKTEENAPPADGFHCTCRRGFFGDGRTCSKCSVCLPGVLYQVAACTARGNARFGTCTPCTEDQYLVSECSCSRDRVCANKARGCTEAAAANYDPSAMLDDGSCEVDDCYGHRRRTAALGNGVCDAGGAWGYVAGRDTGKNFDGANFFCAHFAYDKGDCEGVLEVAGALGGDGGAAKTAEARREKAAGLVKASQDKRAAVEALRAEARAGPEDQRAAARAALAQAQTDLDAMGSKAALYRAATEVGRRRRRARCRCARPLTHAAPVARSDSARFGACF